MVGGGEELPPRLHLAATATMLERHVVRRPAFRAEVSMPRFVLSLMVAAAVLVRVGEGGTRTI